MTGAEPAGGDGDGALLRLVGSAHDPAVLLPALEGWADRQGLAGCRVYLLSEDGRLLERFGPTAGAPLGLHERLAGRVASRGLPLSGPDGGQRSTEDPGAAVAAGSAAAGGWTAVPVRVGEAGRAGLMGVLECRTSAPADLVAQVANRLAPLLHAARQWRQAAARLDAAERFAQRAIEAQEAERARLAREIHDGVAQRLAGLGFQLSAAASLCGADEAGTRTAISAARRLAELAAAEARAAIGDLRPPVLDDLGLAAALASLGRDAAATPGGPDVTVSVTGELDEPLPDHVQTALYRIGQECLSNVVRHAEAATVSIVLDYGPDWVHLTVEDDGSGFELDAGRAYAGRPDSFGLRSMRERAELLGGGVQISSRRDVGTCVRTTVPVPHHHGREQPR